MAPYTPNHEAEACMNLRDIGWMLNPDGTVRVFWRRSGIVIVTALDLDTPVNQHWGTLAQTLRAVVRAGFPVSRDRA